METNKKKKTKTINISQNSSTSLLQLSTCKCYL